MQRCCEAAVRSSRALIFPDQLYGFCPGRSEPDPDQFMKNAWGKAAVVPIIPMIIPINSRSCPDLQPDHWGKVSPPSLGLWVIMGYIGYLVLFHPKKRGLMPSLIILVNIISHFTTLYAHNNRDQKPHKRFRHYALSP